MHKQQNQSNNPKSRSRSPKNVFDDFTRTKRHDESTDVSTTAFSFETPPRPSHPSPALPSSSSPVATPPDDVIKSNTSTKSNFTIESNTSLKTPDARLGWLRSPTCITALVLGSVAALGAFVYLISAMLVGLPGGGEWTSWLTTEDCNCLTSHFTRKRTCKNGQTCSGDNVDYLGATCVVDQCLIGVEFSAKVSVSFGTVDFKVRDRSCKNYTTISYNNKYHRYLPSVGSLHVDGEIQLCTDVSRSAHQLQLELATDYTICGLKVPGYQCSPDLEDGSTVKEGEECAAAASTETPVLRIMCSLNTQNKNEGE